MHAQCAIRGFCNDAKLQGMHDCQVEKRGRRGRGCDVFFGRHCFEHLSNIFSLQIHIRHFCRCASIIPSFTFFCNDVAVSRERARFGGFEVPRYSFLPHFHNRCNLGHFEASLENNNNKRQEAHKQRGDADKAQERKR